MRTLRFIVQNQIITKDPSCDFSGLVPGSDGSIQVKFTLSPEWRDAAVVVSFWSNMGVEYSPRILNEDHTCIIPTEALKRRVFKIKLIGKTPDGKRLSTNKVAVSQNGGN